MAATERRRVRVAFKRAHLNGKIINIETLRDEGCLGSVILARHNKGVGWRRTTQHIRFAQSIARQMRGAWPGSLDVPLDNDLSTAIDLYL